MKKVVSPDEFNAKLSYFKAHHIRVARAGKGYNAGKKHFYTCDLQEIFVNEDQTKVEMTYKDPGKDTADTMVCYLDGGNHNGSINVAQAVKEFYSYYKPPFIPTSVGTAVPILGNNPEYEGKRFQAYEYDKNSAYAETLCDDIPDTTKNLGPKIVESGEIGFDSYTRTTGINDDATILDLVEVGERARYVFKTMPSPYVDYVRKYYDIKKTSTGEERARAKSYLVVVVGNLQNRNPFVRASVVCKANKIIKELIDENVVYWNTDSVVSTVRRPDIETHLGTELGEWKLDHQGEFAFRGYNYQWNHENPSQRGVPKAYFDQWVKHHPDRGWFDLLEDGLPPTCNKYEFDWNEGEVKLNEEYI